MPLMTQKKYLITLGTIILMQFHSQKGKHINNSNNNKDKMINLVRETQNLKIYSLYRNNINKNIQSTKNKSNNNSSSNLQIRWDLLMQLMAKTDKRKRMMFNLLMMAMTCSKKKELEMVLKACNLKLVLQMIKTSTKAKRKRRRRRR